MTMEVLFITACVAGKIGVVLGVEAAVDDQPSPQHGWSST
jgi:hypothetical protein